MSGERITPEQAREELARRHAFERQARERSTYPDPKIDRAADWFLAMIALEATPAPSEPQPVSKPGEGGEVLSNDHRMALQLLSPWLRNKGYELTASAVEIALAALTQPQPRTEGAWRLVPVEPTPAMFKAAGDYADQCAIHNYGGSPDAEGTWDAMISAAPAGREVWRPEVRAFADLMEAQLRANDHKPGWKGEPPEPLWERLREEATELLDALGPGSRTTYADHANKIGAEAADVANFAMMIADVCGALPSPPAPADKKEGQADG